MHRALSTGARWSAAAVAIVLLSGCGAGGEAAAEPEFVSDATAEQIGTAISDVGYASEPTALADVTDFAWDEVAVFAEGAEVSEIEALVGETGIFGDTYVASANLLVFRSEGSVSTLVSVSDVIAGEYGRLFDADAVLRLEGGDSGPVVLAPPS